MADARIGKKDEQGKIIEWPKLYASGVAFDKREDGAPTLVHIDSVHFYLLPAWSPFDEAIHEEMAAQATTSAVKVVPDAK